MAGLHEDRDLAEAMNEEQQPCRRLSAFWRQAAIPQIPHIWRTHITNHDHTANNPMS
jgi:hypothetical protein